MDEQLKKILAQFLQLMLDGIEKGAKFAGEQIPLVLQEKLHYDLVNCLVWAGFWFLAIVVIVIAIEVLCHKGDLASDERIIARMWSVGFTLVLTFPMLYCLDYALYIYMAPRLYILEWLRTLIK